MGLFDKFKGMMDPDANDGYGEDEEYLLDPEEEIPQMPPMQQQQQYMRESAQQQQNMRQQTVGGIGGVSSLELKVVKPEKFSDCKQIADLLLNHKTVVLNLEETNKETARRLIDFLFGIAYAIDGQIKSVASAIYVITPKSVDISNDQMRGGNQNRDNQNNNSNDMY